MNIRLLHKNEDYPMELLLLADPSEELVKSYICKGDCFIAELDHNVVGVYVLIETSQDTLELINLAVSEQHQGQGIGKCLILHAIEVAQSKGYKTLQVGTGNSSIGQLALYQKCGFRITHLIQDYFIKQYEGAIFENGIQCRDMVRLSLEL